MQEMWLLTRPRDGDWTSPRDWTCPRDGVRISPRDWASLDMWLVRSNVITTTGVKIAAAPTSHKKQNKAKKNDITTQLPTGFIYRNVL